jgi:hypothetical protein
MPKVGLTLVSHLPQDASRSFVRDLLSAGIAQRVRACF